MEQIIPEAPIRIGLLVDETPVSKYAYDFAKWALDQPNLIITHLILHSDLANRTVKSTSQPIRLGGLGWLNKFASLPTKIICRSVDRIERSLLNRNERHRSHLKKFDISQIIPQLVPIKIVLTPIVSDSGSVHSFTASEIDKLRPLSLDLMVSCGCVTLRGDILTAAKLGVISFHEADSRFGPAVPIGFWDVYFQQDTTVFTINKLSEKSTDAEVLLAGRIQTQYYYLLNQASVYDTSSHYLKVVIGKIALDKKLPPALPTFPSSERPLGCPGAIVTVLYLTRLLGQIAKTNLQKFLGLQLRWNVAFVRTDWQHAELWRSFPIKNRPFHFLADPFVAAKGGKEFCFVEEFDCRKGKGNIAVYTLEEGGCRRVGCAVEEPFHISFPFVFDFQDELYMCPETSNNRDIRIYKCLEFPLRWRLEKILMKNVSAVDSMLFEMNSRWWLFTNMQSNGLDGHLELSIFHADSPVADTWTAHPQNPILLDSARNAGLIRDGHRCFRISQCPGFNLYGKKILINEIMELTESSYSETARSEVTPNFKPGIMGVHHLDSKGKITVFDYQNLTRIHK